MNVRCMMLLALVLLASMVQAGGAPVVGGADAPGDAITISGAWIRAVPPVSKNSAGYLAIENASVGDDALIGARVANVRVTELHEMVRDGDALSMRHREEIRLPAKSAVTLAPGGLHLMLIDLQRPLQVGEKLEAVLRFRHAGEKKVLLEVRAQ